MINASEVRYLQELKQEWQRQIREEGCEMAYQIVAVQTAMMPDFTGMQKIEIFTGSLFLTRRLADDQVVRMKNSGLYKNASIEIRPEQLALSPELWVLREIVQKFTQGI